MGITAAGDVQRAVFSVRIIRRRLVRAAIRSSSRAVMRARDAVFSEEAGSGVAQ